MTDERKQRVEDATKRLSRPVEDDADQTRLVPRPMMKGRKYASKPASAVKRPTETNAAPQRAVHQAPSPSDELEALERSAAAEEEMKRREAVRRRKELEYERGQAQAPRAAKAKRQKAKAGDDAVQGGARGAYDMATMITVVVSVVVLLLVLWFMASTLLNAMGNRSGVAVNESEETAPAATTEAPATSAAAVETTAEVTEDPKALPTPLTEGDAVYREPDTWVGKTFEVEEDANVRAGSGTGFEIVGTVDPGETIGVKEAVRVDDATWVQGIITKRDGETFEGWIYAYALYRTAQ
ncbi:MAG: SH3 domain-containing protein [Peptoniphilaceae bacterium]|nr:SH3 domain-containing protein [Peptoniphilaceae bacterium]